MLDARELTFTHARILDRTGTRGYAVDARGSLRRRDTTREAVRAFGIIRKPHLRVTRSNETPA